MVWGTWLQRVSEKFWLSTSVCYRSVLPVSTENPFAAYLRSLRVGEKEYGYYDVKFLGGEKFSEWYKKRE